ncbi:polyprenyl synthetase family protein [Thalassoroseus pseudoceratinae]|uniref:polyprenyl synthetase family protein n=1 Tax=Thalassoroseus pseudoceratinae TaxID=2713176 RepID=UPI00141FDFC7
MDDDPKPVKRQRRKSTSHLKAVPETLTEREEIKSAAEQFAKRLDAANPFAKKTLEQWGRELLEEMRKPEKFLGFAMVLIGNFFWKRQFLAIPFERRMLLLPHCLKHAEGCPADYDEFGLDCERCGACSIADYKVKAEKLGYKVLVAEGSPVVLKIIVSGHIDGILGVACLNVLEKAIDKVLIAGVPSYAIPLHSGDCKNTTLDESWVWDVLEEYEPLPEPQTNSYVPLLRSANRLFDKDRFETLLPRVRTKTAEAAKSPIGQTERISYDWLANGGKRFRPFMTLAAYDALTGAESLKTMGEEPIEVSDGVGRVAMAIEAFHKASLVHDDIEDNDQFRYGQETLHRQYDTGTAINVGDYLIGVGYRLVTAACGEIGAEAAADILDRMAAAHIKLCDGQGAEMAWQSSDLSLSPLDALQIYALKTSPAFEAALYAGVRMAGSVEDYEEMIPQFARHVGIGFQILNDLKDWRGDVDNKLVAGQDALALRPTVLLALALQSATEDEQAEIRHLLTSDEPPALRMGRLRRVFERYDVFNKAESLVEKSRARAEALADAVEPVEFRQLLYFLTDTVLADEDNSDLPPQANDILVPLPIASGV